ncbi:DinB family protein [Deinococcus sonorensis]|uniref:DinB family protein n=2 Tax=Deinococcus sonorensis TaxID=309891 RepID=A0AAU7U679_9DEIO
MDPSLPLMYTWVKRTREQLFAYTESLPGHVYLQDQPGLPSSSLRDIHVHVANMYQWWVGRYLLRTEPYQQHLDALPPSSRATHAQRTAAIIAVERAETLGLSDVSAVRGLFLEVDALVERVFETVESVDEPFEVTRASGCRTVVTPRWVLVAQITHEFHHKGQMLAYGRALGAPLPEDLETDLAVP